MVTPGSVAGVHTWPRAVHAVPVIPRWRPKVSALTARLPQSAGSLRRAREARLAAYRQFGDQRGWPVLGLHEDLSYRYPVAPLLGAHSARAELALCGHWADWDALVASVLVLAGDQNDRPTRHTNDLNVQLTMLDTGPDPRQFAATWSGVEPQVVPMSPDAEEFLADIKAFLRTAAGTGALLPGDSLAATEIEVLHTRIIDPHQHELDVQGPLHLLARLADDLS
jgi:hypothetical protein